MLGEMEWCTFVRSRFANISNQTVINVNIIKIQAMCKSEPTDFRVFLKTSYGRSAFMLGMEEKNEKQSEKRQSAPLLMKNCPSLNSPDISASSVIGKKWFGRKLQILRKDHRCEKEGLNKNERC